MERIRFFFYSRRFTLLSLLMNSVLIYYNLCGCLGRKNSKSLNHSCTSTLPKSSFSTLMKHKHNFITTRNSISLTTRGGVQTRDRPVSNVRTFPLNLPNAARTHLLLHTHQFAVVSGRKQLRDKLIRLNMRACVYTFIWQSVWSVVSVADLAATSGHLDESSTIIGQPASENVVYPSDKTGLPEAV